MKLTLLENFPGADVQPGMIAVLVNREPSADCPLLILSKAAAGEMCLGLDYRYTPLLHAPPTLFWAVSLYHPTSPKILVCFDVVVLSDKVKLYKVEP